MACIGALVAERSNGAWNVRSAYGERTEAELLQAFVDRIETFKPQMVTFNGSSFDLPEPLPDNFLRSGRRVCRECIERPFVRTLAGSGQTERLSTVSEGIS